MNVRLFARVFGIVYILVGILGFVPPLLGAPPASPAVSFTTSYGDLLGIFPVNALHSIVHILVGVAGLAAAGSVAGARGYARGLAIVYGLLTILGLIPATSTVFGLIPIFGADIALHALSALIAAYFGWMDSSAQDEVRVAARA